MEHLEAQDITNELSKALEGELNRVARLLDGKVNLTFALGSPEP